MRTGLRKLSNTILDLKARSMAYLLTTYRRTDGSTSTTSMKTPLQRLLITMGSHTLTSLVVATLGLLCLVCTMLMHYWLTGIIVLLVVIAINVILSLKTLRILMELSVWSQGATREQQRAGQVKLTKSGGQAL